VWRQVTLPTRQTSTNLYFRKEEIRAGFYRLIKLRNVYEHHCFCFFIDGLDEYEESGQDDYKSMVKLLHEWTALAPDDVKICVSSREYNVFLNLFSAEKRFRLQELTASDMKRYIEDRLGEIEDQDMRKDLFKAIADKADGIFLWVAIVVKSLRERLEDGYDLPALNRELDTYPQELDPLFKYILKSISRPACQKVYQITAMLDKLKAYDLNLSLLSVSFLENFEDDPEFAMQDTFPFSNLDDDSLRIRLDLMRKKLNGYCKGLLEIKDGYIPSSYSGFIIAYAHRSIPEFLHTWEQEADTTRGLKKIDVENAISQLILAELRTRMYPSRSVSQTLSLTVYSIIKMRALRSLDQSPFVFLEYLDRTLPEEIYSPSHFQQSIAISNFKEFWLGPGKAALYLASPFLISAFLGQSGYPMWKIAKDHSSLVGGSPKLVAMVGWVYRSVDGSKQRWLETTVVSDIHDHLLEQGISPQTMLHEISYGSYGHLRDMTLWELFIITCIRLSLHEKARPAAFLRLGKTIQKFLEHDADPNLAIIGLESQRNDPNQSVLEADEDDEETRSDDGEKYRIEVRCKTRCEICYLNQDELFSLPEPVRELIFNTGKDREISLSELIRLWNFDNNGAILDLIDRKLRREECCTAESGEVNREEGQTQRGDGSADLIMTKDKSAEDVAGYQSTIEAQPSAPSEPLTKTGYLDFMARSLPISHIIMFVLGKLPHGTVLACSILS
jgi:hypothetical protein